MTELTPELKSRLVEAARQANLRPGKVLTVYFSTEERYFVQLTPGLDIELVDVQPPAREFRVEPATNMVSFVAPTPEQWGPPLWEEIHRAPLTMGFFSFKRFIQRIESRLPCGECKTHWRKWMKENPPPFASPEMAFVWTVEAHNAVRRRQGKPEMTVEDARKIFEDCCCATAE